MPIGQEITPEVDPCLVAKRWKISLKFATLLVLMSGRLEFNFWIISGFRTAAAQQRLLDAPNSKAAPIGRSTHTSCPATGGDFRLGTPATNFAKARFGTEAVFVGLRWGGGSPIDPSTGIPSDWNHLDLGPRV